MNDLNNHTRLPDPPEPRAIDAPEFHNRVDDMIAECGGNPDSYDGSLIRDQILNALKLITDKRGTGELKLLTTTLKELRYAYNVFARHEDSHKISIFGSARTQPGHPDYESARKFSKLMAEAGWAVITGAGDGIMKAGHEGPGRDASFGLAIRLPFETTANEFIKGDSKLINFRYFFTRKLIFVSQSEAVACYPGGFGTQDEAFEALTLTQTGKGALLPILMLEGKGGDYWKHWDKYVRKSLLERGMISEEDLNLYCLPESEEEAVEHVVRFYRNYHSSRYVRNDFIIRIKHKLTDEQMDQINSEFSGLVKEGSIVQRGAYDEEKKHRDLTRITFTHTRYHIARLRMLIDRINEFAPAPSPAAP